MNEAPTVPGGFIYDAPTVIVVPHLHVLLTSRYPGTPPEYWRSQVYGWPGAPKGGPEEIAAEPDSCSKHI